MTGVEADRLDQDAKCRMTLDPRSWIIFDGDNTLWQTEQLYDDARDALCRLIVHQTTGVSGAEVAAFQRQRDHELHAEMGYSKARYPRSFGDTVVRFLGPNHAREGDALELAKAVFSSSAVAVADADEVLGELSKYFNIGLLTAGERVIQEKRLEDFGRSRFFKECRIVSVKTAATLEDFLVYCGAKAEISWMVGDSPRSDILPAIEVGMNAIWLKAPNWREVEIADIVVPENIGIAHNLREAARLILTQQAALARNSHPRRQRP